VYRIPERGTASDTNALHKLKNNCTQLLRQRELVSDRCCRFVGAENRAKKVILSVNSFDLTFEVKLKIEVIVTDLMSLL
jgi:hypothetical protein